MRQDAVQGASDDYHLSSGLDLLCLGRGSELVHGKGSLSSLLHLLQVLKVLAEGVKLYEWVD